MSRATRVLVLGGAGFIGRHAVAALLAAGAEVIIGSRFPARIGARLPSHAQHCERRAVHLERCLRAADWQPIIDDCSGSDHTCCLGSTEQILCERRCKRSSTCDVVLNCVGILRERGAERYQTVHCEGPAALAAACAARGLRYVHVSALGLQYPAKSRFLTSKRDGEAAIRAANPDAIIARPSLLDGEGGYGAWWLRMVARLPIYAIPSDAQGKIAALDVGELGEALSTLCLADATQLNLASSRDFELGGEQALPLADYLLALRRRLNSGRAVCVPLPGLLARVVAHMCDFLHATPFSFGHWELLRRDNVPAPNRLAELLGRPAKKVM
jgi:uncharacterized protein YbjT (DUF2867 family)